MKFKSIIYTMTVFAMMLSSTVIAKQIQTSTVTLIDFSSSPPVSDEQLSCKAHSAEIQQLISIRTSQNTLKKSPQVSLKYLNDSVMETYNAMRNGVVRHVTLKVALALFNFSVDGFAAENISHYVSSGTKPYLPFEFANGVKITKVTPKGGTIIYRAEMPITKYHTLAKPLVLAGRVSAKTTVCNDMKMVDDLLGRNVEIQYDYYDSNGEFFTSFMING